MFHLREVQGRPRRTMRNGEEKGGTKQNESSGRGRTKKLKHFWTIGLCVQGLSQIIWIKMFFSFKHPINHIPCITFQKEKNENTTKEREGEMPFEKRKKCQKKEETQRLYNLLSLF